MSASSELVACLIPGAGHVPENFSPLRSALEAIGCQVASLILPTSNGENPPTKTYEEDVAAVRSLVSRLYDTSRYVILVMHSYGGVPAGDALLNLSKTSRAAGGLPGGVVHLMYLCAYALPKDWSIMTLIENAGIESRLTDIMHVSESGLWHPKDPEGLIFYDLEPANRKRQADLLVPWNPAGIQSKVSYAPWVDIPTTYVYTEEDKWVPSIFQKMMTDQIKAQGVSLRELHVTSGHAVFAKEPELLAQEINDIKIE